MALDIDGFQRTLVLVSDDDTPVTIGVGTTWESLVFDVEHSHGRGAWSLDITLDGGGSGEITIELRGGNYRRASLPVIEGFDASLLPATAAADLATAKDCLINVENHNMNQGQVGLAATGDDVTITRAVLKY